MRSPWWSEASEDTGAQAGTLQMMEAWLLDESPGTYRWGDVEDPVAGPGQVRIEVRASALNHMDLWLTTGMPKPPSYPHVPGNDVAGVIEAVGDGVSGWSVGDEVVVNTALVPAEALSMGVESVLHEEMRLLGSTAMAVTAASAWWTRINWRPSRRTAPGRRWPHTRSVSPRRGGSCVGPT
ncbi:MAG: zinc-binding alcohol dehydrogenase family protein [Microthrixaceae bacterium]|nr:zinc-binding alcohol dehydrogenase family protein [Microthrixaceae bacterium]